MKKTELDKIIYNLDGLLFPGSQLGNFYNNKYIQKHFRIQKYLIQKAKTINNNTRPFPIIGICNGYENMILAEKNYNITNKNIKKVFINVEAYPNYKTNPTFIKTKLGNSFKKNFHRTISYFSILRDINPRPSLRRSSFDGDVGSGTII